MLDDPRTAPAVIARVLRSCAEYARAGTRSAPALQPARTLPAGLVSELGQALRRAQETRGRFQLLGVQLEPGAVNPALQRFVGAVQRLTGTPADAIC